MTPSTTPTTTPTPSLVKTSLKEIRKLTFRAVALRRFVKVAVDPQASLTIFMMNFIVNNRTYARNTDGKWTRSDEELELEKSAFESLYGG